MGISASRRPRCAADYAGLPSGGYPLDRGCQYGRSEDLQWISHRGRRGSDIDRPPDRQSGLIDPAGRLRTSSGPQFEDPRVVAFGCDQQRHAIRRKADRFALVQQTALVRRRQTDERRPFPHCGSPGISGHATEQVRVLVGQHDHLMAVRGKIQRRGLGVECTEDMLPVLDGRHPVDSQGIIDAPGRGNASRRKKK